MASVATVDIKLSYAPVGYEAVVRGGQFRIVVASVATVYRVSGKIVVLVQSRARKPHP